MSHGGGIQMYGTDVLGLIFCRTGCENAIIQAFEPGAYIRFSKEKPGASEWPQLTMALGKSHSYHRGTRHLNHSLTKG